jgi:hypothetical protein
VFLLNSRLSRFSAALFSSLPHGQLTYTGHPLSRSYGVILPSSLSTDHSSTLGFSPRLPVSVYGTVATMHSPTGLFSTACFDSSWLDKSSARHQVSPLVPFSPVPGYSLASGQPTPDSCSASVSPHGSTHTARYRNLCLFPIAYASRPRLRGRLTRSG